MIPENRDELKCISSSWKSDSYSDCRMLAVLITSISALGPFVANTNKMYICKLSLYIWYLGQIVHVYKQDLHLVPTMVRKLYLKVISNMYEKECVPVNGYQSLFHLAAIVFYLLKWRYHLFILSFINKI